MIRQSSKSKILDTLDGFNRENKRTIKELLKNAINLKTKSQFDKQIASDLSHSKKY